MFLFEPLPWYSVVMWFVVLGGLGIHGIVQHPEVLNALNPLWGVLSLASVLQSRRSRS